MQFIVVVDRISNFNASFVLSKLTFKILSTNCDPSFPYVEADFVIISSIPIYQFSSY